MFGERHMPPKPPRFEPIVLLGLAVIIAFFVVVAYVGLSNIFASGQ